MALPAAISVSTVFNYTADPATIDLTDDTDYAGEGIADSDVKGNFKITAPNGVIHDNTSLVTPDINGATSDFSFSMNLPTDSAGNVLLGQYQIIYTLTIGGAVQPGTYTVTYNFNNAYERPTVTVTQSLNCFNAVLTSTDATSYPVDGVTPTLVRLHKVTYVNPTNNTTTNLTSSTAVFEVLTANLFTNTAYTSSITSTVTYEFDDFTVEDILYGNTQTITECETNLCSIYCCISELNARYNRARGTAPTFAKQYYDQLQYVSILMNLFNQAIQCGKNEKAAQYLDDIKDAAGCDDDCGCSEGEGQFQIIPIGSSGTTVVVTEGAGITVTSNTVGSTTTYTVALESSYKSKIDALFIDVIAAGTGISVTPVTDGDTITWTVALSGDLPVETELLCFTVNLAATPSTDPSIESGAIEYGSVFDASAIVIQKTDISGTPVNLADPNHVFQNAFYKISDFKATPGDTKPYFVEAFQSLTQQISSDVEMQVREKTNTYMLVVASHRNGGVFSFYSVSLREPLMFDFTLTSQ